MSGDLDPWREYADSCVEHDPTHGRHALEELRHLIPPQPDPAGIAHRLLPHTDDVAPSRLRQLLARVRGLDTTCPCGKH